VPGPPGALPRNHPLQQVYVYEWARHFGAHPAFDVDRRPSWLTIAR